MGVCVRAGRRGGASLLPLLRPRLRLESVLRGAQPAVSASQELPRGITLESAFLFFGALFLACLLRMEGAGHYRGVPPRGQSFRSAAVSGAARSPGAAQKLAAALEGTSTDSPPPDAEAVPPPAARV